MFMKYLYKSSKKYIYEHYYIQTYYIWWANCWTILLIKFLDLIDILHNIVQSKTLVFFFMIKIYFPTSWYELKKIKKRERKLNLKGKKRDKEKVCILMSYFHYTKIDDVYICFFFFFFENPCIYFLWYIVSYIFF